MDKREVARVLEEVAAMMEIARENPFKVRAYENAARAILGFPGDLAEAVRTGSLREVRGIGNAIFAGVQTLLTTGRLPLHEELRSRFPPGLAECLRIPGLGAKKLQLLHEALGIDSLEALERACLEGKLEGVKGFGAKSAERILQGIAARRAGAGSHRIHRALARASELSSAIHRTGLADRVELAGSLRRRMEIVHDIDLVVSTSDPEGLRAALASLQGVVEVSDAGGGAVRALLPGIAADIVVVLERDFGAALLTATGSENHVRELAARAQAAGLTLERDGLFGSASRERLGASTEEEIYAALGLVWIPPELREGMGEIEAAARGTLPHLVEERDLRGVLHVHTTDSDGRASLEEMVEGARAAGYQYVGITDHSKSATYARGLTEERVLLQRARLRALRDQDPGLRLFHGTEADILADGTIDFGDEFLEGFDVVVASIHSRFGLSREEQTQRIIRAVRNPLVSILGHPSGRLLLSRAPVSADWEAVFEAAAESGCAVEINCNPERLDLDWRLCRSAAEAGIPLAINPDAHSVAELGLVPYGVGIARKGWATPGSVLNTRNAEELADWLAVRRGKPLAL